MAFDLPRLVAVQLRAGGCECIHDCGVDTYSDSIGTGAPILPVSSRIGAPPTPESRIAVVRSPSLRYRRRDYRDRFTLKAKNMPHLYIFLGLLFIGLFASCFMG